MLGRCGHTLCRKCIDGIIESTNTAQRCPICRLDFDRDDALPNYVVQAISGEAQPQTIASHRRQDITDNMGTRSGNTRTDERERQRREQTAMLTNMFRHGAYPWWHTDEQVTALLARTALADGRHGPIVDIGAYGSLSGDRWVQEQARRAISAGYRPTQKKLTKAMSVSGVGKGAQTVEWEVNLPIAITDHDNNTTLHDFTTPVIPDSDVPGLLGLQSVQRLRGVIDTFSDPPRMFCCGPGGYEIKLSPGSSTFPLFAAPSGHLILPTSEFDKINAPTGNEPRERALGPQADEPMHLQATAQPMEHGPPLPESGADVSFD